MIAENTAEAEIVKIHLGKAALFHGSDQEI
jgi:hypothetical protein